MARGERAYLSKHPQKALLLNQFGKPYSDDGKSLNRIINEAGKRVGIKAHIHMLRHTYATQTLVSLQRDPTSGVNPLVFLQRQLGHSSIHTPWSTCIWSTKWPTRRYLHMTMSFTN
ncbi:tyrosine-type recombinase/integrase [Pseudomonas alliivorans]|nr:tyrosine-type recombinase/integrase [Pseudomonas alliivorans]